MTDIFLLGILGYFERCTL